MSVERNKEEKFLGVKMSLTMCHIQFLRVVLSVLLLVIYCNSGDLNENKHEHTQGHVRRNCGSSYAVDHNLFKLQTSSSWKRNSLKLMQIFNNFLNFSLTQKKTASISVSNQWFSDREVLKIQIVLQINKLVLHAN